MHRPGKETYFLYRRWRQGQVVRAPLKGSSLFVSPFWQPYRRVRLKHRIPPGRIPPFDLPCPTMAAGPATGMDSTRYNASRTTMKPHFVDDTRYPLRPGVLLESPPSAPLAVPPSRQVQPNGAAHLSGGKLRALGPVRAKIVVLLNFNRPPPLLETASIENVGHER